MRKLASIQAVNAVEPIPNADAIERVRVLGWWVVCKPHIQASRPGLSEPALQAGRTNHPSTSFTTRPWTSVRRKSRPA